MAILYTDRFGLTQWSSSDDDFTREQMNDNNLYISDNAAIFLSGTSASPPTPSASNTKAFYWDKTNGILYYRGDTTGLAISEWTQIHPVLPNAHVHANLQPLNTELTALSGLSTTGLVVRTGTGSVTTRSVAISGTGLSITNSAGLAGDILITLASSTSATVDTLVLRETSGRITVGTPTNNTHATTKLYVDNADALKANAADVYTKTEMADPTIRALLNLQTLDADLTALSALTGTGMVSRTADNTYAVRSISVSGTGISISNPAGIAGNPTITINSTSANTANTIVSRDGSGQFQIGTPTLAAHAATKTYVDTADALKANSADVYTKTELNNAKLYQYANTSGGTGDPLPPSGTRTTPRIYVQSTDPTPLITPITGDIWFQI